jgi:hypothetical protein
MSSVKFLHSQMTGAPQLSGTVGSMIALLDACLINGFGGGSVDSLVVNNNVVTCTRSAGHPYEIGSVCEMSGATVTGGGTVNGQFIVTTVTSTQWTYAVTGVSNQTATGSITHKAAALGWAKPFTGTNLAVYRSPNVAGTRCFLRVNDTDARDTRVVGYETMSDVNTGTGIFPTAVQQSGGLFWTKSNDANATTRQWIIVGDDRAFLIAISHGTNTAYNTSFFGDINSVKSPDPFACMINGFQTTRTNTLLAGNGQGDLQQISPTSAVFGLFLPRSSSGLGSASQARTSSLTMSIGASTVFSGVSTAGSVTFPNPADNGVYIAPMYVIDSPLLSYRGVLPGLYWCFQNIGDAIFAPREYLTSVTAYPGRTFRAINNNFGVAFVDITGPWR